MGIPIAMAESIVSFYGTGPSRNFGKLLEIYNRAPYRSVLDGLAAQGLDVEDFTDINYDVGFWFGGKEIAVALSMVGPYAVVLPSAISAISEADFQDFAHAAATFIHGCGFMFCDDKVLASKIEVWADQPTVYELLFDNDGEVPTGSYVPSWVVEEP